MYKVHTVLRRRLDVSGPLPPDPEGDGSGDGDARAAPQGPRDDLPMLVAI